VQQARLIPSGSDPVQFIYFGIFDPPHLGHVRRIAAATERCQPSRTLLVPLDYYDGETPGRRIIRTKMARALAEATGAVYSDAGLALKDLQALVARLAGADRAGTVVLFDPELPRGMQANDVDATRAGVELLHDAALQLPHGLPRQDSVQRAIRGDEDGWTTMVPEGVEAIVRSFGLYGWSPAKGQPADDLYRRR
jgi:hypothetical protein